LEKRADRAVEETGCGESPAGELTHHLGYAKGEAPEGIDHHRNGSTTDGMLPAESHGESELTLQNRE
jgi:hypothetical protein